MIKKEKNYLIYITLLLSLTLIFSGCHKKTSSIDMKNETSNNVTGDSVSPQASDVSKSSTEVSNKDEKNSNPENNNNDDNMSESSENKNNNPPTVNHAAGKLSVSGGKLVDSANNPVQLHGVSSHGLSWFPEYVNKSSFITMRDDWGVDTIRLSMYTAEYNGYCTGGNQSQLKQLIHNGVDYATDLGMYVIIDWHILSDGNPNTYINEASAFFQEMASTYSDYDNVIFEICNEPNGSTSWTDIKKYANTIIPIIRNAGSNAIILIGTPTWSQDIHLAANDPITGYDNIMYTFHFYAATHKTDLQNRLKDAINRDIPVFVSEFGITDASGNGNVDTDSADTWMSIFNNNNISTVCWNLSNKNESSALIKNSCQKTSGWSYDELSSQGQWLVDTYKGSLSVNKTTSVTQQSDNQTDNTQINTNSNTQNNDNQNTNYNNTDNNNPIVNGNGKASVTCNQVNTWNDGNSDYFQYEVVVKNVGDGTLNGWNISFSFSDNIQMHQYWCCNSNVNGFNISLTPVDYNQNLEPGASANIGFIVKGPPALQMTNINSN